MKIKLLIPILFFVNIAFSQNPGDIDTSYGNNGFSKISITIGNDAYGVRINDTHIFPNGKIFAVGTGTNGCTGNSDYYGIILKLDSNGFLDSTFDGDGYQIYLQRSFYDIVPETQNSFYIIGGNDVLKIDENGNIDTSYGVNGYVSTGMYAKEAVLDNNGGLIIGGDNNIVNDRTLTISKLNPNGTLDSSFGNSGFFNLPSGWVDPNYLYELKLDNSNRIVCVGKKPISYTRSDVLVFRLTNNGQLDTSFDTDGIYTKFYAGPTGSKTTAFANDVIIGANDKITIAAHAGQSMHGVSLIRLNNDGSLDTSFGTSGLVNEVISNKALTTRSVHQLGNGSLVASSEGIDSIFVSKYDPSGQLDSSFNNNGYLRYETGGYLPYRSVSHSIVDGNQLLLVSYEEFWDCNQTKDISVFTKVFLGNNGAPPVANPAVLTVCDLDNDGFATFDLTAAIPQILGNQPPANLVVTFHETHTNAQNDILDISNPQSFINTVSGAQTLYSRVEDGTGNFDTSTVNLNVNPTPSISMPNDLYVVDTDGDGLGVFDLTANEATILGSLNPADFTLSYFMSMADVTNANPIPNPTSFQSSVAGAQTIYVRVENNSTGCFALTTFDLIVLMDTDSDGIPDEDEDLNNNGNLNDDDTDGDGIPDYQDSDDDGDGVPTIDETTGIGAGLVFDPSAFIDTDGDSIQNYVDNDDDGDSVLTIDEDYNNNGTPLDDDTNSNGIPDFLDSTVAMAIHTSKSVDFRIYPNPTKGDLQVQNPFEGGKMKAIIFNLQGKRVLSLTKENTPNNFRLDLSNLPSGIYFLKIKSERGEAVKKLIKL